MLVELDEEDNHLTGVGRQKRLFPVLSRIAKTVHALSTARLHNDHRADVARPDRRVRPGSNYFR